MCQTCSDALNKHLSHLSEEKQMIVLWNWTAFPVADGKFVAKQIRRYARNPERYTRWIEASTDRALKRYEEENPDDTEN